MEDKNGAAIESKKGRRLLLTPLPFQGHINPVIQLGNILHSKGFSITIITTTFNAPDPSNYPQFDFQLIDIKLSDEEKANPNIVALVQLINAKCAQPFRDCLAKLLANGSEEPIGCLIADVACHFTHAVADELKVKRMVLRTSGATSFRAFTAFPLLKEKGYIPIKDSELEKEVVELAPLRVKDLPAIDSSAPEELYELVMDMVKMTKASSGLIWNTFQELEQPTLAAMCQEYAIPNFPIGPFHNRASSGSIVTQDTSCISWLDKQERGSVIYVSFGSVAAVNETELLEVAWGLANSKHSFLWVVRAGTNGSDKLETMPKEFSEALEKRGHIVKWAPQKEVLAHPAVGAFWTHNGWNSTLESICEGVPMVCMPFFTDQKVNARYVTEVWGVGVYLEKLERRVIERTVKGIMLEKDGEKMKSRVSEFKEKATKCLLRGGSSYLALDSLENICGGEDCKDKTETQNYPRTTIQASFSILNYRDNLHKLCEELKKY